ncbi:hypothetical protein, partial [Lysinibacillus fusiformis]|uniref:hypothetical protein n=1 Tax=Lysinibacillus fusiformis TaxID=28031 RepID=UPI0020BFC9EE
FIERCVTNHFSTLKIRAYPFSNYTNILFATASIKEKEQTPLPHGFSELPPGKDAGRTEIPPRLSTWLFVPLTSPFLC